MRNFMERATAYVLIVVIGAGFGLIASMMTFIVIYDEYRKHHLKGWRLWSEALKAAAASFVIFVALSLVAGYWLSGQ
jgi:hypothetical protein